MLPTASGIDLAMACVGATVLPRAHVTTEWTESGSATHAFVVEVRERAKDLLAGATCRENAIEQARAEALARVPLDAAHRATCENVDFAAIPDGAQHELTLAWSPSTGTARVLGQNLERNYSGAGPGDFVGTADLVGQRGDVVIVKDWKTGRRYRAAAESWQLRALAVFAAALVGADEAEVEMTYIDGSGEPFRDRAKFDWRQLAAFAEELRALAARHQAARIAYEAGRPPSVSVGPWCERCASVSSCPEFAGLARELVPRLDVAVADVEKAELDPKRAGAAWLLLDQVELLVEKARAGLKAIAKQRPLELPDGRLVAAVVTDREQVKPEVALAVLRQHYDEATVAEAVTTILESSKAQIERAFKARLERMKQEAAASGADAKALSRRGVAAAMAREAIDLIAAADGIEVRQSTTVRPIQPK